MRSKNPPGPSCPTNSTLCIPPQAWTMPSCRSKAPPHPCLLNPLHTLPQAPPTPRPPAHPCAPQNTWCPNTRSLSSHPPPFPTTSSDTVEGPVSASFYDAIKLLDDACECLKALKDLVDRDNMWEVKLRLENTGVELAKGTLLAPSTLAFLDFASELGSANPNDIGFLLPLADDLRLAPTTARMLLHHLLVDFLPSRKFPGETRPFDNAPVDAVSYPTVLAS